MMRSAAFLGALLSVAFGVAFSVDVASGLAICPARHSGAAVVASGPAPRLAEVQPPERYVARNRATRRAKGVGVAIVTRRGAVARGARGGDRATKRPASDMLEDGFVMSRVARF